jgi:hypothetical protein
MLKCLCSFAPGRPVHYTDLRAHFDHVKEALEEAAREVFMLEMVMIRGEGQPYDWKESLADVRMKLFDAMALWDEKARPALDKKFPHDSLKEALDL